MSEPAGETALSSERSRFNADVAPGLARRVLSAAKPAASQASSRFAYFQTDDKFIIVAGLQEGPDAQLALAYGLELAGGRRLALLLPQGYGLATRQRAPFLRAGGHQPEVFLHDVAWGAQSGTLRRVDDATPQDAVEAVLRRLDGTDPEQELAEATVPVHLGESSAAVTGLVEWVTRHPLLDPSHRRGERSWQCMGQKVLTIKRTKAQGIAVRAGIHYSSPHKAPVPVTLSHGQALDSDALTDLQQQVEEAVRLRLDPGQPFHKPDEHWLQAAIRRAPHVVGVEQPALRELPAWRPTSRKLVAEPAAAPPGPSSWVSGGEAWGRGYLDLVGLDGSGNIRLIETKLAKNTDDLLIFQGLDYYVWALAYETAIRRLLRAPKRAKITIHYVVGANPSNDDVHVSAYADAQAYALTAVPWRFQTVTSWFETPVPRPSGLHSTTLPPGELP